MKMWERDDNKTVSESKDKKKICSLFSHHSLSQFSVNASEHCTAFLHHFTKSWHEIYSRNTVKRAYNNKALKAQPLGERNSDQSERDIDFIFRFSLTLSFSFSLYISFLSFYIMKYSTAAATAAKASGDDDSSFEVFFFWKLLKFSCFAHLTKKKSSSHFFRAIVKFCRFFFHDQVGENLNFQVFNFPSATETEKVKKERKKCGKSLSPRIYILFSIFTILCVFLSGHKKKKKKRKIPRVEENGDSQQYYSEENGKVLMEKWETEKNIKKSFKSHFHFFHFTSSTAKNIEFFFLRS
jgi:hypothetical protein